MAAQIVELRADLTVFGGLEAAAAVLETFLIVARSESESAVLDPEALRLPDDDPDGITGQMIDYVNRSPAKRKFFATTERAYDIANVQQRKEFSRLAYCSTLATVWSRHGEALFESVDYGYAWYHVSEDLRLAFYARLADDGVAVPSSWQV